jgi:23S rRNA-/tRNA-specific pseudouridylate synthase
MTALGHPILGDAFYGHAESADHTTKEAARNPLAHATHTAVPSESSAVAGIEDVRPVQRSVYERAERLLLHATELHLLHPTTGEVVKFTSPCPFTLHDYDTLSL